MNVASIQRFTNSTSQAVVFTDSASTTGGFVLGPYSGAMLLVSATSTSGEVTLEFLAKSAREAANSFSVRDKDNAVIAIKVSPDRAYSLPDELFAAGFVMATTGSAGQTATCQVLLKG